MASAHWFGVGRTETGLVRPTNQDAFAVLNEWLIWVVADGMGGHPAGDVAASAAVEAVVRQAPRRFEKVGPSSVDHGRLLCQLLEDANRAVLARAAAQASLRGMGTTVVIVKIVPAPAPVAHVVHLGDSRAYLYRQREVLQLTRDHTLVEEYLQQGAIDVRQVQFHPERHVLTRALGLEPDTQPDHTFIALQPDDLLLLCSDGLTKMLADSDIASTLRDNAEDPARACNALIDEALVRGGEDNVTVIVCARGLSSHFGPTH